MSTENHETDLFSLKLEDRNWDFNLDREQTSKAPKKLKCNSFDGLCYNEFIFQIELNELILNLKILLINCFIEIVLKVFP